MGQANSRGPLQSYPLCGSYQSLLNILTGYRQAVTFMFFPDSTNTSCVLWGRCRAHMEGPVPGQNCCAGSLDMYLCAQSPEKSQTAMPVSSFLSCSSPPFFFFFSQVVLLMKSHMGLCCSRKCYFYCMLLPSHPVCTFSFQSWIHMHRQPAVLGPFLLRVNEKISC